MSRTALIALTLAVALLAPLVAASAVSRADARSDYIRYAKIRDRLIGCDQDRANGTQNARDRRYCRKMRKKFRLEPQVAESHYRLVCLTRDCPRAPPGEPDPRQASD